MISLGFYFSHAKTLFYIFDINKSIFQQIIINSLKTVCNVSRVTTKPTIWHVRPAKTPISLGIRSVWSESLLSLWRSIKSLTTHWAHSEDSDHPGLRWAHTGHFVGFVMLRLMCQKCLKHVLSPLLGRRDLVCVLLVHLFVCFVRVSFCHFLFLLVSGVAMVCDYGTTWTFLLTVLKDSNQTIGKTAEFIF